MKPLQPPQSHLCHWAAALLCLWVTFGVAASKTGLDSDVKWTFEDLMAQQSPNATAAYQTLSFGIALLAKPANLSRADLKLCLGAWKAAVPRASVSYERPSPSYPRHGNAVVRLQAVFTNQSSATTDAQALITLLSRPAQLAKVLPAATWQPNLVYLTFPFLANDKGKGGGVEKAPRRDPALLFTLKLEGMTAAVLRSSRLGKLRRAVRLSMPGPVYLGMETTYPLGYPLQTEVMVTQEVVQLGGSQLTSAHAHVKVMGPPNDLLIKFIKKLRASPGQVFPKDTFGAVTVEPWSAKLALVGRAGSVGGIGSGGPGGLGSTAGLPWSSATKATAVRLAQYSAAIRCKWPRVRSWECLDCKRMTNTRLLDSFVPTPLYDDAADAITINLDSQLGAIVVSFRSTYGNQAGWLNNFAAFGQNRTIAGKPYMLHSGFSSSYYDTLRGPLMTKLKAAITSNPTVPTIIFNGHSRGGAMAVLAAVDAATEKRAELGLFNPIAQIKLYTFGQPRVGDAAYAFLLEASIGERFRLVSNADPVSHIPPNRVELDNPNSLLNKFADGMKEMLKQDLPDFLVDLVDGAIDLGYLSRQTNLDLYVHHGPQVLMIDYVPPGGARVVTEMQCASRDVDSPCDAESVKTIVKGSARPNSFPYTYPGSSGASSNRWPIYALLDHSWQVQVDVGNFKCSDMKPPGWWGWKLTVGTSGDALSGADGDFTVAWTCGSKPMTPATITLDCGLTLGDVLSGNLDGLNCFETNNRDMFSWEYHNGTASSSLTAANNPLPECSAAGARPAITVGYRALLWGDSWKLDSLLLELAYTAGPEDKITLKTFGDCTTPLALPSTFSSGNTRSFALCETAPWFKWKVTIGTANNWGSGTDGEVRVSWRCGSFSATNGQISTNPVCSQWSVTCFESGEIDDFTYEFNPGNFGTELLPNNYPVTACTAPGTRPTLTISFLGNGWTDAWDLDVSKLALELQYFEPDVTSLWGETTGNQLSRLVTRRFSTAACGTGGISAFPRSSNWANRAWTLC